jgi:hypothetical protein
MKKLMICLLFLSGLWPAFSQNLPARILEIQGKVETREVSASEWKPAAEGDIIGSATIVSTSFKSTAILSLGDSTLIVRPLTMLTLEELVQKEGVEEVRLYLRGGRIRAEVSPPTGGTVNFTIRSPIAIASVRGTSFEFDGKHLRVESGTVLLENNNSQRGYISAGQQSSVDEADLNRIAPPFEAAAALLTPLLPDLGRTGGPVQGPVITTPSPAPLPSLPLPDSPPDSSPAGIGIEWP